MTEATNSKYGHRLFGRFRSRHPYVARVGRNLAITGALVTPLAIGAGHGFSKVGKTIEGVKVISRGVGRGAGIALLRAGKADLRKTLNRAARMEQAAYLGGISGSMVSVASPYEDYRYHRREQKRAGQRPIHVTTVINRKSGARRELYS